MENADSTLLQHAFFLFLLKSDVRFATDLTHPEMSYVIYCYLLPGRAVAVGCWEWWGWGFPDDLMSLREIDPAAPSAPSNCFSPLQPSQAPSSPSPRQKRRTTLFHARAQQYAPRKNARGGRPVTRHQIRSQCAAREWAAPLFSRLYFPCKYI